MQGSQDTFYLTLPSNGYDTIYRDNTPGRFKAKLLKTISLPGKEWEVALSNISFPSTLASKTGNDFRSLVDLDLDFSVFLKNQQQAIFDSLTVTTEVFLKVQE